MLAIIAVHAVMPRHTWYVRSAKSTLPERVWASAILEDFISNLTDYKEILYMCCAEQLYSTIACNTSITLDTAPDPCPGEPATPAGR